MGPPDGFEKQTSYAHDLLNLCVRLVVVASGLGMLAVPVYLWAHDQGALGMAVGTMLVPVGLLATYKGVSYCVDVVDHMQRKSAVLGKGVQVVGRVANVVEPGSYNPGQIVAEVDSEEGPITFTERYVVGKQTENLEIGEPIVIEHLPDDPDLFILRYASAEDVRSLPSGGAEETLEEGLGEISAPQSRVSSDTRKYSD